MQQTEKYKLNLIEPSDPFLPEGLNQNTQKVEDVLKGMEDGPLTAMDMRVTELEKFKFAYGSYSGSGTGTAHFPLGFAPKAVLYISLQNNGSINLISVKVEQGENPFVPLKEDGFDVKNYLSGLYAFIAFG